MMEFLSQYGLFLAKTVTLTVAIVAIVSFILAAAIRQRQSPAEGIEVKNINDHYRDMSDTLDHAMLSKPELKARRKADKKSNKAKEKALKRGDNLSASDFLCLILMGIFGAAKSVRFVRKSRHYSLWRQRTTKS
ncbi:MAG: hypothetical protein Ct9H300mP13_8680 [Gammaproteobacteria bacterium]|nr:MAG: hypothetical protein Ct9H300mP13_8680 [Gammaproteobacteria bacterium]